MTIYDALSQEHGLSVYHDYLLDSNHELLADMCLNQFIELAQSGTQADSHSGSREWSRTWTGSRSGSREWSRHWSSAGSGPNSCIGSWARSSSRSGSRLLRLEAATTRGQSSARLWTRSKSRSGTRTMRW